MSKAYNNIYTISERKSLVADAIKLLRKTNKRTQQEVADAIGINAQTYATYERGRNEAPVEIIVRLSHYYDVPVDVIVQRDNMDKSSMAVKEQFAEFKEVIEEMRSKVLSGDPETREILKMFSDSLDNLTDILKKHKSIDDDNLT